MSYILDALKRADAERERGHVPGLHTRTTPELDAPAAEIGGMAQRGRLIALAALLALGAVLWWWLRAAPPAAPVVPAATPAVQAPAAPVSLASEPSVNPTSETAPPVLPILAPPPPRAPAKAAAPAPAEPASAAQQAPGETAAAAPQVASNAVAPGGAPAAATATEVRSFAELSPEARARLPAVNVSGSTYSKNPTLRMLIVNGKVVQEGGEIAPGLTLETIGQRSAVLNHQGLRYRIGY